MYMHQEVSRERLYKVVTELSPFAYPTIKVGIAKTNARDCTK